MAPGLAKRDLLYLSDDGDGNVYVYSFPDAKLQGTLTGLSFPRGTASVADTFHLLLPGGDAEILFGIPRKRNNNIAPLRAPRRTQPPRRF